MKHKHKKKIDLPTTPPDTTEASIAILAYHVWWVVNGGEDTTEEKAVANWEWSERLLNHTTFETWQQVFDQADAMLEANWGHPDEADL